MIKSHVETEVRFIEIDVKALLARLAALHAIDYGEKLLHEIIFYDKAGVWQQKGATMVRLRTDGELVSLAYKHNFAHHAQGTTEIELRVDSFEKTQSFLKEIGLVEYRHQEKYRHSFSLNKVKIDIDRWPKIPAYVELEGENEESLKSFAQLLGLDWTEVNTKNAAWVIENLYGIPVRQLKYFTFKRVE